MKAVKDLGAHIEKLFQIGGDPMLHSSDKGLFFIGIYVSLDWQSTKFSFNDDNND